MTGEGKKRCEREGEEDVIHFLPENREHKRKERGEGRQSRPFPEKGENKPQEEEKKRKRIPALLHSFLLLYEGSRKRRKMRPKGKKGRRLPRSPF